MKINQMYHQIEKVKYCNVKGFNVLLVIRSQENTWRDGHLRTMVSMQI